MNKIIQNDVINEYDEELIKNIIRNKKVNLFDEIKNYKMIESNGTMSLEFTFTYNDNSSKEAIYKMEFDNQQIIFESFYCQLEKNLVLAFEITNNEIHLNGNGYDGLDGRFMKKKSRTKFINFLVNIVFFPYFLMKLNKTI